MEPATLLTSMAAESDDDLLFPAALAPDDDEAAVAFGIGDMDLVDDMAAMTGDTAPTSPPAPAPALVTKPDAKE